MENDRVKCPYCAEEIHPEAKKCRFCGEWLNNDSYPFSAENQAAENYELICETEEAEDEEIDLFVGKRSDYYTQKWESGSKIGWNWAAATGILWLGYRKMYAHATALLGLFLIVVIIEVSLGIETPLSWIAFMLSFAAIGLFGNYLYQEYTQRSIAKYRFEPVPIKNRLLKKNGGTSHFAGGLVLLMALILVCMPAFTFEEDGSGLDSAVGTETTSSPAPSLPPVTTGDAAAVAPSTPIPFSSQDFAQLFPDWIMLNKEEFSLNNKNYCVVGMGMVEKHEGGPAATIRISVCVKSDKQWNETWHIPEDLVADCSHDSYLKSSPKQYVQDIAATTDNSTALVVANVLVGGAHGTTQVIAFTLDQNEKGLVKMFDSAGIMDIKKDNQRILVTGEGDYGTRKLYLENGAYKQQRVVLSDMAPPDSVKARFIIGGYDSIAYPVEGKSLKLKVGQTIAFEPGDEDTRELFDSGYISIYSDAWNGPPLMPNEANRIKTGNSYKFDKPGTFNFVLLCESEDNYGAPTTSYAPTFTVIVVK